MAFLDRLIRRRILLGVLLAASLALLTAYFREGEAGPLHGSQDTAADVAAPFETAAQRVAQPFRDAWQWGSTVLDAKSQVDRLERENSMLRTQLATAQLSAQEVAELRQTYGLPNDPRAVGLDAYVGIPADVIQRAPSLYSSSIRLNVGKDQSIRVGDPVITGERWLVGQVTRVTPSTSTVALLNDASAGGVPSVVVGRAATGVVVPSAGDPSTLALGFVKKARRVDRGDRVVTSGILTSKEQLRSRYPFGILIGEVSGVNQSETDSYKRVQVTPYADLGTFRTALVLVPRERGAR